MFIGQMFGSALTDPQATVFGALINLRRMRVLAWPLCAAAAAADCVLDWSLPGGGSQPRLGFEGSG